MPTKKSRASASPKRPYSERDGVLLTVAESADYLGITERHMWRLLWEDEIRKTKVRSLVRVHIDDLNAYIEQQRGEVTTR